MRADPVPMTVQSRDSTEERSMSIGSVAGARFASRDLGGMRKTLDEMLSRGVAATKTNPSIFRIARYLLTQSGEFEVQGPLTGGECEVVAIRDDSNILITVGSDQCDRELDPLFQDKPKQMCPHPIASVAWPYHEVRDHWDSLRVYSHVVASGRVVPIQDSGLSVLVDLEFLLAMESVKVLPDPLFLFCGAAPALESAATKVKELGLPPETAHGVGEEFVARLHDPVLDRSIELRYQAIPVGDDLAERRESRRPPR